MYPPAELNVPTNANLSSHWLQPNLLFSQTCGYPIVDALEDQVQVIGAFRYTAPGCDGILGRTASAPGTPRITALDTPPALLALLRQSFHQAMADPALAATRAELLVGGFEAVDATAYAGMKDMDRQASALGLVRL